MKSGGAHAKGADFERLICERLSLWVSNRKREDVFWRSAMSGGRANLKSRRKHGMEFSAQSGDITAIHELGHALLAMFVLECKFYRDIGVEQAAYGYGVMYVI